MRETTIDQIVPALQEGATLVDVREAAEYREGHVPGAINIPMGQLAAWASSTATVRSTWSAPRATAAAP